MKYEVKGLNPNGHPFTSDIEDVNIEAASAQANMLFGTNNVESVTLKEERKEVYMSIMGEPMTPWDKCEQIFLGVIYWSDAVKTAKAQSKATRLSNSKGCNNQGYYFVPDNPKRTKYDPDMIFLISYRDGKGNIGTAFRPYQQRYKPTFG